MRNKIFISLLFFSQFIFGQSEFKEISDTTSSRFKLSKLYENLFPNYTKAESDKYIGKKLIFVGNDREYKAVLFSPNLQTVSVKNLGITESDGIPGSKPFQNIVSHIYHADVSKLLKNAGSIAKRDYMNVIHTKDVIGKQFEVTDITFDADYVDKCLSKIPEDFILSYFREFSQTKDFNKFYMPCDFQTGTTYMPYLILREIESSEIIFCNKPSLFTIMGDIEPLKKALLDQTIVNRGMAYYGTEINSGQSLQIGKNEKWLCKNVNVDFQKNKVALVLLNPANEKQEISIPIEEILKNSPSLMLESDYIADINKNQLLDLETQRLKNEIEREKALAAKEQEAENLKAELENLKIEKGRKIEEKKQKEAEITAKKVQVQREIEQKDEEQRRSQTAKLQVQRHRQTCINKYGEKLGALIASGQVSIGMTKEMCQEAKGVPYSKEINTSASGTIEDWNYYSAARQRINCTLRFVNAKLLEINESK